MSVRAELVEALNSQVRQSMQEWLKPFDRLRANGDRKTGQLTENGIRDRLSSRHHNLPRARFT